MRGFQDNAVLVAVVKKIPLSDIEEGKYRHLNIGVRQGEPEFPESVVPNPDVGTYSRTNLEGKEIVRRDLPMTTKTISWDAPNWGDYYYGSHTMSRTMDVYQRDYIPPKELEIKIEILGQETIESGPVYIMKLVVDQVLDKTASDFEDDLFYNANLLQENVGAVDVFPSAATLSDYLDTVFVEWEILPPGNREENIRKILSGVRKQSLRATVRERYEVLEDLDPVAFVRGTSGFRRYFGAKFADDLVAFENLEYGNALYVMFEDWETLSQKNRLELLKGSGEGFERIIHTEGWAAKLKQIVDSHRGE